MQMVILSAYVIIVLFPSILSAVSSNIWYQDTNAIGINVFGGMTVLYDNSQGFYLTNLVFKLKKYSRDQGGVHKQLKRMILLNLSILLFDWFGMGLFVIETINQVDNVNLEANFLLQTTVQVMVGIHCVCLIYVLEMLKKLSLLGLKTKPLQVEESMAKTVKISP